MSAPNQREDQGSSLSSKTGNKNQGKDIDGPVYGDWITVSKFKKSNPQKANQVGQKGVKDFVPKQNKFHILRDQDPVHLKDAAVKERGKEVHVSDQLKTQQPMRTWVRKRPRRDREGSSGLKSQGAQQERANIFVWPDGVCTSLPPVHVSCNHFHFLDVENEQSDEPNKEQCKGSANIVGLAKPKEPPDALNGVVVSSNLNLAMDVGQMRDTGQSNP
ncbi:putative ubiquitin carboxyl-terminal hydrolase 42 isoform X2 [Sesbania bispinosa]|nr:putative ubiquitin carboxyl-terminal hydrolase 42 isoform X2 [Sesbania bispinosa]